MPQTLLSKVIVAAVFGVLVAVSGRAQTGQTKHRHFVFGTAPANAKETPGTVFVSPGIPYSAAAGYGFEPQTPPATFSAYPQPGSGLPPYAFVSADRPFYFSVQVPPGNYRVTVTFAGGKTGATPTVKAELRRLMLENVFVPRDRFVTHSFVVNVRTPQIAGGGAVRLKAPRETVTEAWAWDDKLTLEFGGESPLLSALTVEPVTVPTVYLLGDSTVCDQSGAPYASWGQMLPRFFGSTIAVSNQAESGETVAGATHAGRFQKILGDLQPGDYVLVQFGHNDMKSAAADASAQYQNGLRQWVRQVKEKGGIPVLLTPVNRHTFDGEKVTNSLRDYPDKVRELAASESVALIDLNTLSKTLYEALGAAKSAVLFAPQAGGKFDHTHHSNYGAYEMAKCVAVGMRRANLKLTKDLTPNALSFDPARPDPAATFAVPESPRSRPAERPAGS